MLMCPVDFRDFHPPAPAPSRAMLLNGLALLGGTPSPRVVATLPKEEDLHWWIGRSGQQFLSISIIDFFMDTHGFQWIPMGSNDSKAAFDIKN